MDEGPLSILFQPEIRADPYPLYQRLREDAPITWAPPGEWILSRYADVAALLRDARMSSDSRNSDLYREFKESGAPDPFEDAAPSMLFVDPPDHTRLRGLVSKAFTARVVDGLRPRVEALVEELLDRAADAGRMDIVQDVAYPLPVRVICELLGVPKDDRDRFHGWSGDLVHLLDPFVPENVLAQALGSRASFREYFKELFAERRVRPRDDLISGLIRAEDAGQRLTEEEMLSTCILLLVAGHETTVNLISNGTLALLRNPDQLARLREDAGLLRTTIEELLRFDSPVQLTGRTALADLEVGGQRVKKGQQVILLLGAANRDPGQFRDPDRLDLTRVDNRHVAFGGGIHFCLGAPLARLEGRAAIGALVRRFPGLRLETEPPEWRDTVTLRGLRSLPVGF